MYVSPVVRLCHSVCCCCCDNRPIVASMCANVLQLFVYDWLMNQWLVSASCWCTVACSCLAWPKTQLLWRWWVLSVRLTRVLRSTLTLWRWQHHIDLASALSSALLAFINFTTSNTLSISGVKMEAYPGKRDLLWKKINTGSVYCFLAVSGALIPAVSGDVSDNLEDRNKAHRTGNNSAWLLCANKQHCAFLQRELSLWPHTHNFLLC